MTSHKAQENCLISLTLSFNWFYSLQTRNIALTFDVMTILLCKGESKSDFHCLVAAAVKYYDYLERTDSISMVDNDTPQNEGPCSSFITGTNGWNH